MNKTGIWKQVNNTNQCKNRSDGKDMKQKSGKKVYVTKMLTSYFL